MGQFEPNGAMRRFVFACFLGLLSSGGVDAMAGENTLFDFSDPRVAAGWTAINDVVMGGISSGGMKSTEEGAALFVGEVSLENNGGFASVRSSPARWDLGAYAGISMRVRGDGQRYKLNLKTDASFDDIMYRVPFQTREGEWQTLRFPFSDFRASFRGREVPEAPRLDPARVASFGVLISDKQAGPFRLEIARIAAYAEPDQEMP
jgi:monofunctional biosynthetic peptidoglycan transglycosylase